MIIAETGESLNYAELERSANQTAHRFRLLGLQSGDSVALLMTNGLRFFEIVCAAQRAGLFLVAVSTRLTVEEGVFIVSDCGARVLVASPDMADLATAIGARLPSVHVMNAGAQLNEPTTPIVDEAPGADMLYSSGTTGRPKGIRSPLPTGAVDAPNPLAEFAAAHYRLNADTVYLSPAPLYHAAPLRWCLAVMALGGTVVVIQKFDAEAALAAIARYRASASQWVPTHFIRMLKLPDDVRSIHDISSMRVALHAGAPCPEQVKRAMLTWWGPVLYEYYGGTENFGATTIAPEEWLERPGSVGRAMIGHVRICDDAGELLPPGRTGGIFFESDTPLAEYHGDAEKTRASRNRHGWATYGDIGHIDADGYLYLTDRKDFTIISGGVNIYPREIEDVLIGHPKVRDVAVIGAPDAEMGELVVAVVEPVEWDDAGDPLATELVAFTRARLSSIKVPRRIDFMAELPRQPTGKLFKRLIQDRYRNAS